MDPVSIPETSLSISVKKLIVFLIVCIGLSILYYKKVLSVESKENKVLKSLKHGFAILSLVGLLSIFSTVKSITGKFILLVVITLIANLYNINHSITKCNFPPMYKVNIFGRSSMIIFIVASLLYYSYEGSFFRFLYSERRPDSGKTDTTVADLEDALKIGVKLPTYCPDAAEMNSKEYEEDPESDAGKKWAGLDPEKRQECLSIFSEQMERRDMSEKIYA